MNNAARNSEQLKIENSMDLMIVLLYAPGARSQVAEPIEGITRLQKLIFLLQQGIGPKKLVDKAKAYGYEAYKMGPFSSKLNDELEELKSAGIILTERLEYLLTDDGDAPEDVDPGIEGPVRGTKRVESLRFSLSEGGKTIGEELWDGLDPKQKKGMLEFKSFFNSLSLRQLLIFTYERFPDYTGESTIKSQLGLA